MSFQVQSAYAQDFKYNMLWKIYVLMNRIITFETLHSIFPYRTTIECPEGTYKNFTSGSSLDDCKPCPSGEYCDGLAQINPTGLCAGGWFCTGGSWTNKPTGNEIYNGTWTCPLYNIGKFVFSF